MKVTAELIEKYHQGLCTEAEAEAVEKWLAEEMDTETEVFSLPHSDQTKATYKQQMWEAISEVLPPSQTKNTDLTKTYNSFQFIRSAAAVAAFVFLILGGVWWTYQTSSNRPMEVYNLQDTVSGKFQAQGLNIELGPNSQANINASSYHKKGQIDFCGMIMINSSEDMELTLYTGCKEKDTHCEKVTFKKGQTYIAVNYKFDNSNELIVVNEHKIIDLPPVLQREIIKQFDI